MKSDIGELCNVMGYQISVSQLLPETKSPDLGAVCEAASVPGLVRELQLWERTRHGLYHLMPCHLALPVA